LQFVDDKPISSHEKEDIKGEICPDIDQIVDAIHQPQEKECFRS